MAKVYDEWINKVTKLREDMREYEEMASRLKREKETEQDAILNELVYIKKRINASSAILTDKDKTAFFFVVTPEAVSYTHLRAHETRHDLVCRLLLEKKKKKTSYNNKKTTKKKKNKNQQKEKKHK